MYIFRYADLHCHPNLKSFGHSFNKKVTAKSDMWYCKSPSFITKNIHRLSGITKFSQADFTTLSRAKAGIIFLSLYPFEKGFFINEKLPPSVVAAITNWIIEIGYERIRFIQKHRDYFSDLQNEYHFVLNSRRQKIVDGKKRLFQIARNWDELQSILSNDHSIAIILTIEGAHVFNSGLSEFGIEPNEQEILSNIETVKNWDFVPLFIGLAHNFNNDLCGHARSLHRIGRFVNQEPNIDTGISDLGKSVIHALLDDRKGKRIYIDLKHMSLASRQEYFDILHNEYNGSQIPLIVSHGAVTGLSWTGDRRISPGLDILNSNDINFFDEEIVQVALSGGLFALQMDAGIQSDPVRIIKNIPALKNEAPVKKAALIIWNQLQYIATLLDSKGLYAWGTTAIGSDFDGSINPFRGVTTASGLELLANELVPLADRFLSETSLSLTENRQISGYEIVHRFMYSNTERFLKSFFR